MNQDDTEQAPAEGENPAQAEGPVAQAEGDDADGKTVIMDVAVADGEQPDQPADGEKISDGDQRAAQAAEAPEEHGEA